MIMEEFNLANFKNAPYIELDDYKAPDGIKSYFVVMDDNIKLRVCHWINKKKVCRGTILLQQGHNEFIENIKMALEYKSNTILSKKLLNRSLINLDEIALSSVSGDTNLLEDIDTIISDLKTNFNELYTNLQEESE